MKTREYEFEGKRYRWEIVDGVVRHTVMLGAEWWTPHAVYPTPSAAAALAALIEDMQVQVIAEWETHGHEYRARNTDSGIAVEWLNRHTGLWTLGDETSNIFRAGYEAGKAAQAKPEAPTNNIQVWVNGDKQDTAAEVARRIAEQLKHRRNLGAAP